MIKIKRRNDDMILLSRFFSSNKKEKEKNENLKDTATSSAIIAGSVISEKSKNPIKRKLLKSLRGSRNNSENAEKIREQFKEANDKGIKIVESPGIGTSMYTGNSKRLRKTSEKIIKNLKKRGVDIDKTIEGPMLKSMGKNVVLLDNKSGSLRDADVLAHELGHAHYHNKGSKNIIAKLAHKTMPAAKFIQGNNRKFYNNPSVLTGFASGINSARNKANDEKEGIISKNISWALPSIAGADILTAEGAASLHGLKDLKRLGADKATIKSARKRLITALGTYGVNAASGVIKSLAARETGKLVGKVAFRKKKKNETKDKKDDNKS